MKKKILLSAVAASAVAVAGVSCSSNAQKSGEFRTIDKEASFRLDIPDSLKFDTSMNYYSTAKVDLLVLNDAPALEEALMGIAFPEDSVSKNWDAAVERFIDTPVDYMQTSAERVDSVPSSSGYNMLLSKSVAIDTLQHSGRVLTFSVTQEGYSGGAHGYYSCNYVNYDTESKNVVTSDTVFADKSAVRMLILSHLAAANNLKSINQLQENGVVFSTEGVTVPENFYFEGSDVVFFYNPYEISSWAQGAIKVNVPVEKLSRHMTDYGRRLAGSGSVQNQ